MQQAQRVRGLHPHTWALVTHGALNSPLSQPPWEAPTQSHQDPSFLGMAPPPLRVQPCWRLLTWDERNDLKRHCPFPRWTWGSWSFAIKLEWSREKAQGPSQKGGRDDRMGQAARDGQVQSWAPPSASTGRTFWKRPCSLLSCRWVA